MSKTEQRETKTKKILLGNFFFLNATIKVVKSQAPFLLFFAIVARYLTSVSLSFFIVILLFDKLSLENIELMMI